MCILYRHCTQSIEQRVIEQRRSLSAKEALIIGLFYGKWPIKIYGDLVTHNQYMVSLQSI